MILIYLLLFLFIGYLNSIKCPKIRMADIVDADYQTGDLLFLRSPAFTSAIQQALFGSFVNHCSMIYKTESGALWVWDCNPKIGAYMTPFEYYVRDNWEGNDPTPLSPPIGMDVSYAISEQKRKKGKTSKIYVRRRIGKPLDAQCILRFIQKNIGRPYSYRFWPAAFTRSMSITIPFNVPREKDMGMFCSELIAHTLAEAGCIDTSASNPEKILPVHFWENEIKWIQMHLSAPEELFGEKKFSQTQELTRWIDGVDKNENAFKIVQLLCERSVNS